MSTETVSGKTIFISIGFMAVILIGGWYVIDNHQKTTSQKEMDNVKAQLQTCDDLKNSYFWKSYLAEQTVRLLKNNVQVFRYVDNLAEECNLK
jgi:hypothetical protein